MIVGAGATRSGVLVRLHFGWGEEGHGGGGSRAGGGLAPGGHSRGKDTGSARRKPRMRLSFWRGERPARGGGGPRGGPSRGRATGGGRGNPGRRGGLGGVRCPAGGGESGRGGRHGGRPAGLVGTAAAGNLGLACAPRPLLGLALSHKRTPV